MLKIQQELLQKTKAPMLMVAFGLVGMGLFSYLTFIPEQTSAAEVSTPIGESRTLSGINTMQEMNGAICYNSAENETKQLKDSRDGNLYWVTKLKDGNCWMTQNLDYNIKAGDFSGAVATKTGNINSGWSNTQTAVQSWDPGNYYYKYVSATDWTNCGASLSNMSTCPSKGNWTTTAPAAEGQHYHVGNYYSWNAATAGTGGSITSGQASASICPTNWKLPTSNNTGSFRGLKNAYSITGSNVNDKIRQTPLYFIPAGAVDTSGLGSAGSHGYYWTSTPYSNDPNAYYLTFYSGNLYPSDYFIRRYYGFSVRCLAEADAPETPGILVDSPNVAITVNSTITIDATSGMDEEADFSKVTTGTISATISANQAYSVLLSTQKTALTDSAVDDQQIDMITADKALAVGVSEWGIKKKLSAAGTNPVLGSTDDADVYSPVGTGDEKVLFYQSANPEQAKTIDFSVGVGVSVTLAPGSYATDVTVTAAIV